MLTDKHIDQWAGYLIENFANWLQLEKVLHMFPEFEKIFIAMYKKGYEDCAYDNSIGLIKSTTQSQVDRMSDERIKELSETSST